MSSMSIIVRRYNLVQWKKADPRNPLKLQFDLVEIDKLIDLELNSTIKCESDQRAAWNDGSKRKAKIWDCKILFSHAEKERVDKVCDHLIKQTNVNFYSADKDVLAQSRKVLSDKSKPDNSRDLTPHADRQPKRRRIEPSSAVFEETGSVELDSGRTQSPIVHDGASEVERLASENLELKRQMGVLKTQMLEMKTMMENNTRQISKLKEQNGKVMAHLNEIKFGGLRRSVTPASRVSPQASPMLSPCTPLVGRLPIRSPIPISKKQRGKSDYVIDKNTDEFREAYRFVRETVQTFAPQDIRTPCQLIRLFLSDWADRCNLKLTDLCLPLPSNQKKLKEKLSSDKDQNRFEIVQEILDALIIVLIERSPDNKKTVRDIRQQIAQVISNARRTPEQLKSGKSKPGQSSSTSPEFSPSQFLCSDNNSDTFSDVAKSLFK